MTAETKNQSCLETCDSSFLPYLLPQQRWREHFLLPRLLLDELELMQELAPGQSIIPFEQRDPVCGMSVPSDALAPNADFEGITYRFCSEFCREQFLQSPS
jgi:trehalose synthase